jgi:hypothetical protein
MSIWAVLALAGAALLGYVRREIVRRRAERERNRR